MGVVADTHQYTLATALPNWFAGEIYMPYAQSEREDGQIPAVMKLLVKPGMDSPGFRDSLERIARNSTPDVPIGHVRPLGEITNGSIAEFRATMRVFVSFAGTAILLAAIGIYGLMSQWVGQRTYEIGLRVAIGATRERIVSMILKEGLRLSAFGIGVGLIAVVALTRFLESLLYGVGPTDVFTVVLVTLLVVAVALAATAFPALRAARIDPALSLRAE